MLSFSSASADKRLRSDCEYRLVITPDDKGSVEELPTKTGSVYIYVMPGTFACA